MLRWLGPHPVYIQAAQIRLRRERGGVREREREKVERGRQMGWEANLGDIQGEVGAEYDQNTCMHV